MITLYGHGSIAKQKGLKEYEKSFYLQCDKYRNKMISGLFELELNVYYENQRPDLDSCESRNLIIRNLTACLTTSGRVIHILVRIKRKRSCRIIILRVDSEASSIKTIHNSNPINKIHICGVLLCKDMCWSRILNDNLIGACRPNRIGSNPEFP